MLQCCITPICNFAENSREDQAKQILQLVSCPVLSSSKWAFAQTANPSSSKTPRMAARILRSAYRWVWDFVRRTGKSVMAPIIDKGLGPGRGGFTIVLAQADTIKILMNGLFHSPSMPEFRLCLLNIRIARAVLQQCPCLFVSRVLLSFVSD